MKLPKRFDKSTPTGTALMKSSVQRGFRSSILEQYGERMPAELLDEILPKKEQLTLVKCPEKISLILNSKKEPMFFQDREGRVYPTLKLLHKYPSILPPLQVDRGAVRFILGGANIMCPGLTSPGARMDHEVPSGCVVAVAVEGKDHAVAVALTELSTEEIRSVNKGVALMNAHFLGDGLYGTKKLA